MEKLKFNIKGMHCQACAKLIEENITKKHGVISARVSPDTHKAVVMFNPQKINKAEIFQAVKDAGDYTPEELKEEAPNDEGIEDSDKNKKATDLPGQALPASKIMFFIGLLTAVSIISIIFNIFLGTAYLKSTATNSQATGPGNNGEIAKNNLPSQPATNPTAPAVKQSFQISKNDHVRGNFDAPITLVEFSDFECPFCGRHFPTLKKILSDYSNQVRLVYKHFPLSNIHPNSQKAAEASECADEQGKFWEYHDKLFDNQTSGYSLDKFKQWANDLKLDSQQFNSCLDSGKYTQKIQTDYQEGANKGVQGTPATFVNGQLVSGALPYDNFKQIIDSLL